MHLFCLCRDGAVAQASQEQKKIALEKAQRDHQQKQAPTEDILMSNTAIKQQQIVQQHELQRQLEQIADAAPQQQPGQQLPQQQKAQLSAAQVDLMQQSKATQQKARGRPKKSDSATTVKKAAPRKTAAKVKAVPGSAEGPGALTDLPEGLLQQRKASNPRESPSGAGDVAYD